MVWKRSMMVRRLGEVWCEAGRVGRSDRSITDPSIGRDRLPRQEGWHSYWQISRRGALPCRGHTNRDCHICLPKGSASYH